MHRTPTATPNHADGLKLLAADHRAARVALGDLALLVDRHWLEADEEVRSLANRVAHAFSVHLCVHEVDEELHVFANAAANGPEMARLVLRLQAQHETLGTLWRDVGPRLRALAAGHVASEATALRSCVHGFQTRQSEHLKLEETLLYPRLEQAMDSCTRERMGHDILTRRRQMQFGMDSRSFP